MERIPVYPVCEVSAVTTRAEGRQAAKKTRRVDPLKVAGIDIAVTPEELCKLQDREEEKRRREEGGSITTKSQGSVRSCNDTPNKERGGVIYKEESSTDEEVCTKWGRNISSSGANKVKNTCNDERTGPRCSNGRTFSQPAHRR
eukprot:TRINITY_DN2685_c0_g1_i10.p5 TRINITY_DN2685_c0_g1~~TRINITY_DN2685_c0_g1_i10.p5  ORF type:complete len:144 (-),score=22.75 TRINITY_DN2685_c0_g1_i10:2626-3057(-)